MGGGADADDLGRRWRTPQGEGIRRQLVERLRTPGATIDPAFGGFGAVDGRLDLRGLTLEAADLLAGPGSRGPTDRPLLAELRATSLKHVDLSYSSLRQLTLTGVLLDDLRARAARWDAVGLVASTLRAVELQGVTLDGYLDEGCTIERMTWADCEVRDATLASRQTRYVDCRFERARLVGKTSVFRGVFDRCLFRDCRLKGLDFGLSSFERCRFEGRLEEVTFHGDRGFGSPAWWERLSGRVPPVNRMLDVDLSRARLAWVRFTGRCDLSTVILPEDPLVERFDDWPAVYARLAAEGPARFDPAEWALVDRFLTWHTTWEFDWWNKRRPSRSQRQMILDFRTLAEVRGLAPAVAERAHAMVVEVATALGVLGRPRRGASTQPARA